MDGFLWTNWQNIAPEIQNLSSQSEQAKDIRLFGIHTNQDWEFTEYLDCKIIGYEYIQGGWVNQVCRLGGWVYQVYSMPVGDRYVK